MVSGDKPLHVRVAEALGWTCLGHDGFNPDLWRGCPPSEKPHPPCVVFTYAGGYLADYERDWSATGPLIERLGIGLYRHQSGPFWWVAQPPEKWHDEEPEIPYHFGGRTPLLAVCELLVAWGHRLKPMVTL